MMWHVGLTVGPPLYVIAKGWVSDLGNAKPILQNIDVRQTDKYLLKAAQGYDHVGAMDVLVGKRSTRLAAHAVNVFTGFVIDEIVRARHDAEIIGCPNAQLHRRRSVLTTLKAVTKDGELGVARHFTLEATADTLPGVSRHGAA